MRRTFKRFLVPRDRHPGHKFGPPLPLFPSRTEQPFLTRIAAPAGPQRAVRREPPAWRRGPPLGPAADVRTIPAPVKRDAAPRRPPDTGLPNQVAALPAHPVAVPCPFCEHS